MSLEKKYLHENNLYYSNLSLLLLLLFYGINVKLN